MTQTRLHIGQLSAPPDLSSLDIKRREKRRLQGAAWTVTVIGSSHYIGSRAHGYHELCSCRPIDGRETMGFPLTVGLDRTVRTTTPTLEVETVIEGRPLAAFPGPEIADIAYRFGPEAYTTIRFVDDGYRTYHTYPEHDLALYTSTALQSTTERQTHEPQLQR